MPAKIKTTHHSGEFPVSSFKYGPLLHVRTLYISFVQGLFAAAPPGAYRWSPLLEETELVVTDENPIHLSSIGKRPAISFSRGPVQAFSLGQDDMLDYDFETGRKKKSILVPGTMSVNACARNDIESEQLAWIIGESLWMHREMFMRAGFFEIGRNWSIGSPSPAGSIVQGDGADEWTCTTVQSPFQFYRTSTITPLGAEIIQEIAMRLQAQLSVVQTPTLPANPVGGTPPYRINSSAPGVEEGRVPHPLNPAQSVTVRTVRAPRGHVATPSATGRTIPIEETPVEESGAPVTVVTNSFKV